MEPQDPDQEYITEYITDLQYNSQNAEVPMGPEQPAPTVVLSKLKSVENSAFLSKSRLLMSTLTFFITD